MPPLNGRAASGKLLKKEAVDMELGTAEIWRKFLLYSGETADGSDPEREELCRTLCEECGQDVGESVRSNDAEAYRGRLESLAAAMAFSQLAILDEALSPESVNLPELSWKTGDRAEKARRLAEEKQAACGAVLTRNAFYFGMA